MGRSSKSIITCDVCHREAGALTTCMICGKEYCYVCEAIICGCMVCPKLCKDCVTDDRKALVQAWGKKIKDLTQHRDRALLATKGTP